MSTSAIWLTPKMDVYISEFYPDRNFAHKKSLYSNRFRGSGDIYRSLLQFDLCDLGCNFIPPNSTITCASLQLPIDRNEVPSPNNLYVYRVLEQWDKCTVTWNNQPLFSPIPEGSTIVPPGFFGTLCIDITDLVESWYDGFYKNFGILLTCFESIDSLLGFFSTRYRNSDYWPRLRISYFQNCCKKKRRCRCSNFGPEFMVLDDDTPFCSFSNEP